MADLDVETRTLDELDPPAWGPPPPDATGLVRKCHALRQKPLADFEPGDLRVMIGQEISLRFLVPRALVLLEANHLIEADSYPGDLLLMVLAIDKAYWQEHVREWQDVNLIADEVIQACEYIREPLQAFKFDTFK